MKVCELITPATWTQGCAARTADGTPTLWNDPAAVKWDLLGAIYHCYPIGQAREVELRVIQKLFGCKRKLGQCLSVWGDDCRRTYAEVIRVVADLGI